MRREENPATALVQDYCAHVGAYTCNKEKQRKSDLYHDVLGYYWCNFHRYRGELLLWASQHDWIQIAFSSSVVNLETRQCTRYAIGDDSCKKDDRQSLWETAVLLGTDDMVMSAYRYVFGQLEEI